jgi:DNA-binding transcriptional ArsR family regulator
VNGKPNKKANIEVASDQLKAELVEIKERLGALETIASISNRTVVEALVRSHLTTKLRRKVMKECKEPRTKNELVLKLGFASVQALDHHLTPLREADLIHQRSDDDGVLTFEWSKLFKGLPKNKVKELLDVSKTIEKPTKSVKGN